MEYVSSRVRRFVILREAGGIGDIVRTFPVARGLKEKHAGARVEYVCLAGYEGLVRLSPDVDRVFTVTGHERRPRDATPDPARFPYLRRVLDGTPATEVTESTEGERQRKAGPLPSVTSVSSVAGRRPAVTSVAIRPILIDLYCPAYRHEVETEGAVTLDRVEIFARAAGVDSSTPRIEVPGAAIKLARAKLRRFFERHVHHGGTETRRTTGSGGEKRVRGGGRAPERPSSVPPCLRGVRIGLAPYATHVSRGLPDRGQVLELASGLHRAGARLVFFHSWKCARPGRDEVRPRSIGAYPALRLPWSELAATIAACDLVISVDTGIFHLAGALGVKTLGLFGPTSGEIMCRPYPTHTWITPTETPPGCDPPCYGRPARGYSKDVCGRVGCHVMVALRPAGVCAASESILTRATRRAR